MPVQQYELSLDVDTLEIFPAELISDSRVVFHGTCGYHSENIETNGFVIHTSPYNITSAAVLCTFLESQAISPFDQPKGIWNWTVAQGISHYTSSISAQDFRISFGPLSGEILFYTQGRTKGGQAIIDIREAKDVVYKGIAGGNLQEEDIPAEVKAMFAELDAIDATPGVIYAVRLPEDLSSIDLQYGRIHSSASIPVENIIGKVIVDPTFVIPFSRSTVEKKRDHKLHGSKGFGRALQIFREQIESNSSE